MKKKNLKENSICDFANLSLIELEDEVVRIFGKNKKPPEPELHLQLLDAIIFRMATTKLNKKDILKILTDITDSSFSYNKELDEKLRTSNSTIH
jgi:hypothetical protein